MLAVEHTDLQRNLRETPFWQGMALTWLISLTAALLSLLPGMAILRNISGLVSFAYIIGLVCSRLRSSISRIYLTFE